MALLKWLGSCGATFDYMIVRFLQYFVDVSTKYLRIGARFYGVTISVLCGGMILWMFFFWPVQKDDFWIRALLGFVFTTWFLLVALKWLLSSRDAINTLSDDYRTGYKDVRVPLAVLLIVNLLISFGVLFHKGISPLFLDLLVLVGMNTVFLLSFYVETIKITADITKISP